MIGAGTMCCLDQRLPFVYEELHRIAPRPLLRERAGTPSPTAAHMLKVSTSTAKRESLTAKAWLMRELNAEPRS